MRPGATAGSSSQIAKRELLKRFWAKLEAHRSLIFYYCNHGNPIDENTSRIIVGVGRVADLGPQLYFGTTPKYQDQYPVWSRRITQAYPDQGVRIPYQEYLRDGHPTEHIICRVPRNALLPFSYAGEHVSDDLAELGAVRVHVQERSTKAGE